MNNSSEPTKVKRMAKSILMHLIDVGGGDGLNKKRQGMRIGLPLPEPHIEYLDYLVKRLWGMIKKRELKFKITKTNCGALPTVASLNSFLISLIF